jgi:hypothetical protein
MTATHSPASPVIDQDRRRACRMAHAFGAAVTGGLTLLLAAVSQFRTHPGPLPVLLAAGAAIALAAGVAADLAARPAGVRLDDGWLVVSRLGHTRRVHTGYLVSLSPNPHAAGSVVLADEAGNRAEIDIRALARNPLIWQRVSRGVNDAHRSGALKLAEPEPEFWLSVVREVAAADRHTLAALDFDPSIW